MNVFSAFYAWMTARKKHKADVLAHEIALRDAEWQAIDRLGEDEIQAMHDLAHGHDRCKETQRIDLLDAGLRARGKTTTGICRRENGRGVGK